MKVVSFYRFIDIDEPETLRNALHALCEQRQLLGTILVAGEGVNGAIAGTESALQSALSWIEDRLSLPDSIDARWSESSATPFRRMRVKVKREIVTLGRPDIRPQQKTGVYVHPQYWNALIEDPEVLLVDTRNRYEIEVGSFARAVDPGTDNFRQFNEFASRLAETSREQPVAMFCTGGIRCEKATALLLELGFAQVYQLEGGILNYLSAVPAEQNRWLGECFVFDTRVAVDRDLAEGGYVQCHACRRPLDSEDLESAEYREGVSCPYCIDKLDADRAERLEQRRRQVALARQRGETHIGAVIESGPRAGSRTRAPR